MLISENHFIRRANDRELIRWSAPFKVLHHFGLENLLSLSSVSVVHYDGN